MVLLISILCLLASQEVVSRLNMMIRWICSVKLRDKVPSEELRSQLGLGSIENAEMWDSSLVWSCSTHGPRHMA